MNYDLSDGSTLGGMAMIEGGRNTRSRRDALKKLGAGVAVAWSAPIVVSQAASAQGSPGPAPTTTIPPGPINLVVNGDAETGDSTGWSTFSGMLVVPTPPGFGSFAFANDGPFVILEMRQVLDVSAYAALIDTGTATVTYRVWADTTDGSGSIAVGFYDAGLVNLGGTSITPIPIGVGVTTSGLVPVTPGTRNIIVGLDAGVTVGTIVWDNIAVTEPV